MSARPPEVRKALAHFGRARRELRQAVERFAEIDARKGHRAEAARCARAVYAAADEAVVALGGEAKPRQ